MSKSEKIELVIEALKRRGRPSSDQSWPDGQPDYVAEYELTAEHIPALISLASTWVKVDSDDDAVYSQVHAWRALGQLRAAEAVQPLLDHQQELDDLDDDWYLEDFHLVFGLIGPPAIDELTTFLKDTSNTQFPRGKAASGLAEIAIRFPESRQQVIEILTDLLSRHDKTQAELNGHLVWDLMNLNAVEAAESIERAFAANVIDPTVAGDWGDVRHELGIEGLGLAPERTPGWLTIAERIGIAQKPGGKTRANAAVTAARKQQQRIQDQRKLKESKERARAKRKEQKKSRKRNRKAR